MRIIFIILTASQHYQPVNFYFYFNSVFLSKIKKKITFIYLFIWHSRLYYKLATPLFYFFNLFIFLRVEVIKHMIYFFNLFFFHS